MMTRTILLLLLALLLLSGCRPGGPAIHGDEDGDARRELEQAAVGEGHVPYFGL